MMRPPCSPAPRVYRCLLRVLLYISRLLCVTFSVTIVPALVWIPYTKHSHLGATVVRKAACGQGVSSQPGSRGLMW